MSQVFSEQENKCFISENLTEDFRLNEHLRPEVRQNICEHLPADYLYNGKFYCVLHFPGIDKKNEFNLAYEEKKNKKDFDFRWVYFPENLFIANETIEVDMNFSDAHFTNGISLISTTFKSKVSFAEAYINGLEIKDVTFSSEATFQGCHIKNESSIRNTVFDDVANFAVSRVCDDIFITENCFNNKADFRHSDFCKIASFNKSEFKQKASFNSSEFSGKALFQETIFFSEARFDNSKFSKDVSFRKTIFKYICVFDEVNFHEVTDFTRAEFHNYAHFLNVRFATENNFSDWNYGGYFKECRFYGFASFIGSKFKFAEFYSSEFKKAVYFGGIEILEKGNFESSVFESDADFRGAKFFRKVSLANSAFKSAVKFSGASDNKVFYDALDLQFTEIDNPEKVYFHTTYLCPNWFVNTDCKQFIFTACIWKMPNGDDLETETEIKSIEERKISQSNKLLTKICWQLADNHEESKSFPEASLFRRMAFESETLGRKQEVRNWFKRIWIICEEKIFCWQVFSKIKNTGKELFALRKTYPFDLVHFLYRVLSGYGEKWFRAFCWLLFIWIFFATFYTLFGIFGSEKEQLTINFLKSLGYSVQVMTLQRPEPRPYNWITYLFYGIETILAPVQAALLALAIRRKFMR